MGVSWCGQCRLVKVGTVVSIIVSMTKIILKG